MSKLYVVAPCDVHCCFVHYSWLVVVIRLFAAVDLQQGSVVVQEQQLELVDLVAQHIESVLAGLVAIVRLVVPAIGAEAVVVEDVRC